MLPLSVCIYSRLCSNPLPQPLPPFPLVFRVGYRPANGLPRIYIGRLCAPDYRASSQLFARVTTKLPAATLSIDASRFQKLMKLGPPSSFQVGSPSFPAKSRPLAILPIFPLPFSMLMLTNACSPFLFLLSSFPFLFPPSRVSEEIIRGVENGTIWSNCSGQLGKKLARIRSSPPRSSSLYRSLLARWIRVNEERRRNSPGRFRG